VLLKTENPAALILSGTTPVKAKLNERQNWNVKERIPPLIAYPFGILCIGDPFGSIGVESGT